MIQEAVKHNSVSRAQVAKWYKAAGPPYNASPAGKSRLRKHTDAGGAYFE